MSAAEEIASYMNSGLTTGYNCSYYAYASGNKVILQLEKDSSGDWLLVEDYMREVFNDQNSEYGYACSFRVEYY